METHRKEGIQEEEMITCPQVCEVFILLIMFATLPVH